jgi:hypothetical protein
MKPVSLLFPALLFVTSLAAQDTAAPSPAEDISAPRHAVGIDVSPTAGKPFSGRDCTDFTSHIENRSDQTVHLNGALVARDSQGRVYREIRIWAHANPAPVSRLEYVILLDPVARTRTECKVVARRCTITDLTSSPPTRPSPDDTFDTPPYYLHRTSLGGDVIEGVTVEGSRITSSLDVGVFVNNEEPVASLDFWHSSDLGIDLSVTRAYKNGSSRVVHVVGLSRSEPDPVLFQPPAGFVVQDLRRAATKSEP